MHRPPPIPKPAPAIEDDGQASDLRLSDFALALSVLLETVDRRTLRAWLGDDWHLEALVDALPRDLRRGLAPRKLAARRKRLEAVGVGLVAGGERHFPQALAAIPDAPLLLYYRGDYGGVLAGLNGPAVAIVGARRATAAGRGLAHNLGMDLAAAGAVVVSGLALGIDAAAHLGALEAGGVTVAVLGSGPDLVQPLANLPLAERILASGGLILSEYPPGTPAAPFRFPERNRIISGLVRGVVVVEASARSGSLITARLAGEQGREVMAVPGPPGYTSSSGTNRLLKNGAALIESAADVLLAIGSEVTGLSRLLAEDVDRPGDRAQQRLLDLLDGRARTLDELATASDERPESCAVHLTALELDGFVQRVAGGYIRRPSDF